MDLRDAVLDVLLGTEHGRQHRSGVGVLALAHQIAWRLRHPDREDPVDGGGHHGHDEHPAPRLPAQPQLVRGAAGARGEDLVGQQGGEDTDGDRELLQRPQPPAHGGGRDLRDVGGGDHGGDADPHTRHEAPERQVPRAPRDRRQDGRDEEQDRTEDHHVRPAPPVGELATRPGAERAAQEGDRHHEPGDGGVQLELPLDRVDGAVDDRRVEPEQEATDGGRDGQPGGFSVGAALVH